MLTLNTSISEISRVGSITAKKLFNIDIETVEDLLFYFPFRYDDFSLVKKIDEVQVGENVSIVGQVELLQNRKSSRRKISITEALVTDETGSIKIIWFNQPFIVKNLQIGDKISLAGKIEEDYGGEFMASPIYEKIGGTESFHTQGLVPNYHLTSTLTQKQLRFLIHQVINLASKLVDWLPEKIKQEFKLISLAEAVTKVHVPKNQFDVDQAKRRLAFDELFLIQLQTQLAQGEFSGSRAAKIDFLEAETKKFVASLPFELTEAQRKTAWEILQNINRDQPMTRLLEGDVGSGKTVVATMAMLNIALNHHQAVLMVPTEILAQQHYHSICKLLASFDIPIGLITGSDKKINRELTIENKGKAKKNNGLDAEVIIQNADIIIGTHALIQEKISFKDLALAVIDEQHRFGVGQRKTLVAKAGNNLTPHLLTMTATPIPRSLALALYGDLDISIINQLPAERKQIVTKIVPESKRMLAYNFIRKEIDQGRQVFVICPLIDISDKLGVKSVKEEFLKLDKIIFPDLEIGLLHGKLKAAEKERVMQDFLDKKIKILVSTSVVEVGVDVPNATVMMIEGAERFGLAQLHQFRGRVGRSEHQSYCFLFTDSDLPLTLKRLEALVDNHDGFALAKIDLNLRGPGEVYGQLQKGFPELKIASLFDYELMKAAKEAAGKIIIEDKSLAVWPLLRQKLGERGHEVHLE